MISPARASRFTNTSAFSKSGKSHADPFSQNDRRVALGRVTLFRSRMSLERISGMKVPGLNRTPNHSPCGGQSAMVALVSGPRTMRVVRPSRRMTTMSQVQAAIEWNTPVLSL
jgi:hypothetical protein